MKRCGRYVGVVLAGVLAAAAARGQEMKRAEIAKAVKPAVALVDAKPAYGSAFCIHPGGLFLTNNHVVAGVPEKGTVKLVLDAGLPTQRVLTARVIRRDKDLDLALLSADGEKELPAVGLGSDAKLAELTELVVFGFPFGTAMARPGEYPTVTVNVVNVSALRTDSNRELNRIQVDSNLNPGNSGGPVVDSTGKLMGVVVAGIEGAGINLLIPVRHVRQFIERPVIALTPPVITLKNEHDALDFQVVASSLLAEGNLDVELDLKAAGAGERTFPMKLAEGKYGVKAVPFPALGEWCVPLEVKFAQGSVAGLSRDLAVKVGFDNLKMSQVRTITMGAQGSVELIDGRKITGAPAMGTLTLKLGSQSLDIKLADAVALNNLAKPEDQRLDCVVIARKDGKEVGRYTDYLFVEGTRHDTLEGLAKGDFVKPLPVGTPTTYLKSVSTAGDYIGQGNSYTYGAADIHVNASTSVIGVQAGPWQLEFAAPRGGTLAVGDYPDVKRYPFNANSPGLSITGNGRGSNEVGGRFVIWELVIENGKVTRLAVDFDHRSEGRGPPFYGMLRINSTLE